MEPIASVAPRQPKHRLFEVISDICRGNPHVAILMSGTDSNARNILEQRRWYPNFQFTAIATDTLKSNAACIASQFGLSFIFSEQKGDHPSDKNRLFRDLSEKLRYFDIDMLLYAGFMKIAPPWFVAEFPGIGIHPADLTITNEKGIPKYRGLHAVKQVIDAGEKYIASSVYVVEKNIDRGLVIAVSKHLPVPPGRINPDELQQELKYTCEHELYPEVLACLSKGKITRDILPRHGQYNDLYALAYL